MRPYLALLFLGVFGVQGCAFVAGTAAATAGAVGAIAFTNRGARTEVAAPVAEVDDRARKAFDKLDIATTASSVESRGEEQSLEGRIGETDVVVEMTSSGKGVTHVDVRAKRGWFSYDKELARRILEDIISA
jgi:hypothetical protein